MFIFGIEGTILNRQHAGSLWPSVSINLTRRSKFHKGHGHMFEQLANSAYLFWHNLNLAGHTCGRLYKRSRDDHAEAHIKQYAHTHSPLAVPGRSSTQVSCGGSGLPPQWFSVNGLARSIDFFVHHAEKLRKAELITDVLNVIHCDYNPIFLRRPNKQFHHGTAMAQWRTTYQLLIGLHWWILVTTTSTFCWNKHY